MLTKNQHALAVVGILFITIASCKSPSSEIKDEVKELKVDFSRFEKDLFYQEPKDANFISSIRKKQGSFADLMLKQVIGLKGENDSLLAIEVGYYTNDKYIKEVFHDVDSLFKDTHEIQEGIVEGFGRYKELFPGKLIPAVKTFIAPFNYNTVVTDSVLGIGLDMYLGDDYRYYPSAGFPLFKIRKLRKEYIVSDAIAAWLQSDYQPDQNNNDLLNNLVQEGKILYAVDQLLPDIEDTIKYGYSKSQLQWCEDNEENIWKFFIAQKLLYNKNTGEFIKFINDGASTTGFPKEAPARLGTFIGLKIVTAYMKKNSNVTLKQLMEIKDGGKILIESGYKPEK
jgi:hypothetical protein